MAATFNIVGNLGGDAETKFVGDGLACSTLSVATKKRKKNRDGQWEDVTYWHRLTLWRHDNLLPHLVKGRTIAASGQVEPFSYETDGQKRYGINFVIDEIELIGSRGKATEGASQKPASKPAPEDDPFGDDVPF